MKKLITILLCTLFHLCSAQTYIVNEIYFYEINEHLIPDLHKGMINTIVQVQRYHDRLNVKYDNTSGILQQDNDNPMNYNLIDDQKGYSLSIQFSENYEKMFFTIRPFNTQSGNITLSCTTFRKNEKRYSEKLTGSDGKSYFHVTSPKAYFHNEPNSSTRRKGYLVKGEFGIILNRTTNFIYIEFTNSKNQKSKGWIKKADVFLN